MAGPRDNPTSDLSQYKVVHAVASYMSAMHKKYVAKKIQRKAYDVANNAVRKHLLPAGTLMNIPLLKLTAEDIDRWQTDFLATQEGFKKQVKTKVEGETREAITRTVAQARNLLQMILNNIKGYDAPEVRDVLSPEVERKASVDWDALADTGFGSPLAFEEETDEVSLGAPGKGGVKPKKDAA